MDDLSIHCICEFLLKIDDLLRSKLTIHNPFSDPKLQNNQTAEIDLFLKNKA